MKIEICNGKTCRGRFSHFIKERIENDIEKFDYTGIELKEGLCSNNCKNGPIVHIDGELVSRAEPAKIAKLIQDKKKLNASNIQH